MVFNFYFGYHSPEAWPHVRADPDFDFESTGAIRIIADDEEAALRWGVEVAAWYLTQLHSSQSDYTWSKDDYAAWVEQDDDGLHTDDAPIMVEMGEYPDLDSLKEYLGD